MKIISILIFLSSFSLANEADFNASYYGILTLLPPFLAIVLAFVTKDVIFSLFVGALSGTFMLAFSESSSIIASIIPAFISYIDRVLNSMTNNSNAGIIMQVLTIGGLIALITKNGGTKAVALWFAKKAKDAKNSQFATWCMGLFIFFDDYANSLIIGPVMRPISDKFRISREKLAFIIDSTAAPVTGLAIISTWIGLEISLIHTGYDLVDPAVFASLHIARDDINAFEIFVQTIPYRFYNLFILIFVLLTIYMGKEFGPMLKAEKRARAGEIAKEHLVESGGLEDEILEPDENTKLKASNAILPLLTLIIFAILSFYYSGYNAIKDEGLKAMIDESPLSFFALRTCFAEANSSTALFQSAVIASILAIILGIYRKTFTLRTAISTWLRGWKTMISTVAILLCAWSLSSVIKDLGTSKYLIEILTDATPLFLLPTVIFLFASLISFSTGTSYGTMGILMPLAIPLAMGIGVHNGLSGDELHHYMVINIATVLTGAVFGDHCSPISDTTILASMGSKCSLLAHVNTQMPYALSICVVSILCGYLPITLGLNVYLCLGLGVVAMIILLALVGKKVES